MNECVRPRKKLALHSGRGFAPNAGSSASNKRHLYSGPSCSSPLKAPRNKRHLYSASSCDIWRSKALFKSGYLKIKIGYLTPAFLGAASGRKCYLTLAFSGVTSKGDKIFGRLRHDPMYGP